MGTLRRLVDDQGIGGHFPAATASGPVFGGGEQGAANSLPAEGFFDIPSLDIADGVSRIAAVGMRTKAGLKKAGETCAVGGPVDHRKPVNHWKRRHGTAVEVRGDFAGVVFGR